MKNWNTLNYILAIVALALLIILTSTRLLFIKEQRTSEGLKYKLLKTSILREQMSARVASLETTYKKTEDSLKKVIADGEIKYKKSMQKIIADAEIEKVNLETLSPPEQVDVLRSNLKAKDSLPSMVSVNKMIVVPLEYKQVVKLNKDYVSFRQAQFEKMEMKQQIDNLTSSLSVYIELNRHKDTVISTLTQLNTMNNKMYEDSENLHKSEVKKLKTKGTKKLFTGGVVGFVAGFITRSLF